MKSLESITTSLEVSKRLDTALKKANIKVEPLFWWVKNNVYSYYGQSWIEYPFDTYLALTASEIDNILPEMVFGHYIMTYKQDGEYYCIVRKDEISHIKFKGETLQDANGEMLCYLADNELLK